MLTLSLMASNACPPALLLYKEQGMARPLQDLQPLLPTPGPRQEITRSSILSVMPYEQDDLFRSACALYGHTQFIKRSSVRRMPLRVDLQDTHADAIFFSTGIDDQWTKHKHMLRLLMSGSSGLKEHFLDPSILPEFQGLQAMDADMDLQHVTITCYEFKSCYEEKASLLHPSRSYYDQEIDCDLVHDLPSTILLQSDYLVGTVTDMKELISVAEEFSLRKDSAQRTRQLLVPHFRWNDVMELEDLVYPSTLKLEAVTAAPLKSLGKVKLKPARKRKSKKATKERDPYRSNSLHACESFLTLMMDKKRNGKSVMNSLKKSGAELPQLLTQFSASIAGTGLAVLFSVLCKVASGSMALGTSNLLTSGFSVGLFSLAWAVNKLRDTILHIGKNSAKQGFQEEQMMERVNKNVNDIVFRAAASMTVLMLRFAAI